MERWSYKPEVEGLSPSLGTKSNKLSGRDSSRQNGDCLGAWSSKRHGRPHAPALSIADCGIRIADRKQVSQIRILHSTIRNSDGPRSRRRSSKPNLLELGGKARGSTREIKTYRFAIKNFSCVSHGLKLLRGLPKSENGCVAQTASEQASHKREVGGSTPPTARSFFI